MRVVFLIGPNRRKGESPKRVPGEMPEAPKVGDSIALMQSESESEGAEIERITWVLKETDGVGKFEHLLVECRVPFNG